MGKEVNELFKDEHKRADDKEEQRKRQRDLNYMMAAMVEKSIEDKKIESEQFEENLRNIQEIVSGDKEEKEDPPKKVIPRQVLIRAINAVKEQRADITEAHKKADERIEKIRTTATDDQAAAFKVQLIAACFRFANSSDRKEAAVLAAMVKKDLGRLREDPQMKEMANLSPAFIQQAETVSEMGRIIERGLAAVEASLKASMDNQPALDDVQKEKNLRDIMAMEIIRPKDIFLIKSPELEELEEVQKKQEKLLQEKQATLDKEIKKTIMEKSDIQLKQEAEPEAKMQGAQKALK